jgi:predicted RNA polymerase sigma factor
VPRVAFGISLNDNYYSFHATRADLLRRLGRECEAAAYERAASLAPTTAERDFLRLGGRASKSAWASPHEIKDA